MFTELVRGRWWKSAWRRYLTTLVIISLSLYAIDGITKGWHEPSRMEENRIEFIGDISVEERAAQQNASISAKENKNTKNNKNIIPDNKYIDFSGVPYNDPKLIEYIQKHKLFPPSTKPYNLKNPKKFDHSESGQSMVLKRFLHDMNNGFFVEAGAYDGESFSNSFYFETHCNWTGLLVEANPEIFFKRLLKKGRKVHSVQTCLSLKPVPTTMYFRSEEMNGRISNTKKNLRLQCLPLYSLLLALNVTRIDLLSLDIEGDELKVLKTIPWDKITIRLMLIEVNNNVHVTRSITNYLKPLGYSLYMNLRVDLIYGRKDLLQDLGKTPLTKT